MAIVAERDGERVLSADCDEDLRWRHVHLPARDPLGAHVAMFETSGTRRILQQRRTIDIGAIVEAPRQLRDMRVRWQRVQREIERAVASSGPGERADVRAAPDLAADQSLSRGELIGTGDRPDGDADRRREIALRREAVAGTQPAGSDVIRQGVHDLPVCWSLVRVDLAAAILSS